jgi:bifunctional DNase/RNase
VKRVDLIGLHVEAASGAPLVLLREHDAPHRVLPISVGGHEAAAIAFALSGTVPPRPLTHDLMAALVRSLDAQVDALEVTELRDDGAFLAELAVSGSSGGHRLDTRPSDGIALALRLGVPVFASEAVLDAAGTILSEAPDEAAIDDAVAEFRSLLDDLDPSDFGPAPGPELAGSASARWADDEELSDEVPAAEEPSEEQAEPGNGEATEPE